MNSLRVATGAEISSSEAMGIDVSDETIISRSHLSEKQQHIKQNFEEKERLEAKRLANEEKKKKKIVCILDFKKMINSVFLYLLSVY